MSSFSIRRASMGSAPGRSGHTFFSDAAMLFAMEGLLFQITISVNSFVNNLFATNLGATDAQIGLVQTVPNLVAVLLLIPLGLLYDRTRSIRTVPLLTLIAMTFGYAVMTMVPMADSIRIPLFFFAIAFTVGANVLYNAQWQTFFGEVVELESRNRILTRRNKFMYFIGIVAPIICGQMLSRSHTTDSKIRVFQMVFFLCVILVIMQMLVLRQIPVRAREQKADKLTLKQISFVFQKLLTTKEFLMFFVPAIVFYMLWQFDWSMWYIGQTQYLGMTESQLAVFNGIFNIGQLLAIGLISKLVEKKGNDFTICLVEVGMIICPFVIVGCALLPKSLIFPGFTVLANIANMTQCITNLCIVQILLRVSPKDCRALAVSLYTLTITLTNSFMPYLGVRFYTWRGADYRAFAEFYFLTAALRVVGLGLFIARYRYLKKKDPAHKL